MPAAPPHVIPICNANALAARGSAPAKQRNEWPPAPGAARQRLHRSVVPISTGVAGSRMRWTGNQRSGGRANRDAPAATNGAANGAPRRASARRPRRARAGAGAAPGAGRRRRHQASAPRRAAARAASPRVEPVGLPVIEEAAVGRGRGGRAGEGLARAERALVTQAAVRRALIQHQNSTVSGWRGRAGAHGTAQAAQLGKSSQARRRARTHESQIRHSLCLCGSQVDNLCGGRASNREPSEKRVRQQAAAGATRARRHAERTRAQPARIR